MGNFRMHVHGTVRVQLGGLFAIAMIFLGILVRNGYRPLWPSAVVPHLARSASCTDKSVCLDNAALIVAHAQSILRQKLDVIDLLSSSEYTARNARIYNSSVGAHIRHSLDHFQAVLAASTDPSGSADYDTRARNTVIENDKAAAREFIVDLQGKLEALDLGLPIRVSFMGESQTFQTYSIASNIARELSFAAHHGIHHMSMVRLLLDDMGHSLPDSATVGLAPSTVKEGQRLAQESKQLHPQVES